nr:LysR family transcriptional regulator [Variovorax boronicumulans]
MPQSLVPPNLRYLDQVARSGSIQAAAKELHVAASAIHRQILQLEEQLGAPLFERLPRGMRLTVAGDAVVTLARRWRQDERRLASEIRRFQGQHQGHVTLHAMDSHATSVLPALVAALGSDHPLISLSVNLGSTDEALGALMAGTADIAAVFNLPPRREVLPLWRAELPFGCVVAPNHPLATARSVSLQEAAAYPVALQSRALAIRRYLDAQYGWLFDPTRGRFESNSLQLVKQLALGGRYVVFTSELDAAPELAQGLLRFVPVRDKGAEPQTIAIAVDATRPLGPVLKVVAEHLQTAIEQALAASRSGASKIAPPASG